MTVEFTKLSKLITYFELKKKVELEILHCKKCLNKKQMNDFSCRRFFFPLKSLMT